MLSTAANNKSYSNTNKILTVAPNCGFHIRKQLKTTAEQEQALRDELHLEIENKTKACSNIAYDCTLPRIEGYEYCLKHILQDSKAPYKQCAYTYTVNGKRCTQPAPKYDPKKDVFTNFCFEHSRLTQLNKTKATIGKFKNIETNETLLNNLAHHVNTDKVEKSPHKSYSLRTSYDSDDSDVEVCNSFVNPFVDIDSANRNNSGRQILDYASDSTSDDDHITISNTWKGQDMDCSDNESVDSQNEDLLKHAGIYTTEEAIMITKEKMKRLQALYIEQVFRLQHLLKEKRRKYIHNLKLERETLCSIHDQAKSTFAERKLYEKLKALSNYHKRNGVEAILHRKFIEKRTKASELMHRTSFHNKCIFTEGGVKCGDRTIPCLRFCKKHVLEDKRQILFRSCQVEKGGVVCQEPVPCIFEDCTCVLHIEMPIQNVYTQKKYESDTEEDDTTTKNTIIISELSPVINKRDFNVEEFMNVVDHNNISEIFHAAENNENNITICHDTEEIGKKSYFKGETITNFNDINIEIDDEVLLDV